jgi:hypothetical protein
MSKRAISVTLDTENLIWLRARTGATGLRSVSELIDRLVTQARTAGTWGPARSVVGTIDIDAGDPSLDQADSAVRAMFDASLRRPTMVREVSPPYGRAPSRKKPRGRA